MVIRIGTRQSPLALWQAEFVSRELNRHGIAVELVKITTAGDTLVGSLAQSGGVGLFTKEIQRALLDGRCDVAVHSLKDLPTESIKGLLLAAVPARENPADCLLSQGHVRFDDLPSGATLGTGSPRRRAQILHARPDLKVADIRGNVDTRIKKLNAGEFDAIVLAFAGLHRLGLDAEITETFSFQRMIPAVGQAALGLETRADDTATIAAIQLLNDAATHAAVRCERELLRQLRAGCLAPVAAHAVCEAGQLILNSRCFSTDYSANVATTDGMPFDPTSEGDDPIPELLAHRAMVELKRHGADRWLHGSNRKE